MSEGRRFVRHGPSHGFLGVNYFASYRICSDPGTADHASTVIRPQESVTATGWPVDPFGLTDLLARVHQDYGRVPLIITENGAALTYPQFYCQYYLNRKNCLRKGESASSVEVFYRRGLRSSISDKIGGTRMIKIDSIVHFFGTHGQLRKSQRTTLAA
ncbi:MAG: hypothetical protein C7B43_02405 [Sulfobacillus benefaciens]|uniref:Glycoside hydrolase family 1 protein n=1 Tax=Sulfobacillus benefaciens TaxID=453960 RepID=A0A2T2X9P5_9FIRM|nr:MAG: hypothetical protein C7B43_02405 [Sulfobacillus benefaciens]